ncbi:MAG TPA: MFS transporter [Gemmataceae bacterium]|nr:MFS transporter [Gemmataceae bacterium]
MSPTPNHADAPRGLWAIGRALSNRNYRLFFGGQGISLIGTWMTRIATGWLVFQLSDPERAAFWLGVVGFMGQVPALFLGPLAGALVDRWNRQRLLIVTQVLSLVQSAGLAVVAFAGPPGQATIWAVIGLAFFQGLINSFDMPGRQAFLVEMVARREDLPNAIALNSSLVNGARLVGPSLAGVVIALMAVGWCFVIDAVSYVAVIAALLAMTVSARRPERRAPIWQGVVEGFRYAFGFAPIRSLLLLLALVSFMGMPYSVLMPIFAVDILHGGAYAYGFLMAASGVGALVGALHLAARHSVVGLGRTIIIASSVFGIGLIGFGLSRLFWLSMGLLLLTGFGMMVQMAASNTILQTIVDEDKRGRVMSFYSMAFLGTAPFGSLFAGALAGWIGAPYTVVIGGIACLTGAGLFALHLPRLRVLVRPIYIRMGILPEMAAGLSTATEYTQPPQD